MNNLSKALLLIVAAAWTPLTAATFDLPPADEAIVGTSRVITARYEDTLVDIARRHSLGFNEIRHANPRVDTWLPGEGTKIVLPTHFILPDAPREGIVINIAEMRLYYYRNRPDHRPQVITFPISIGRKDWQTPLATTSITAKAKDPTWYPPESVREEHAADGDPLPKIVPPGPDNPLGRYALRLGLASYLIHGTNKPFGIGMQVTHGCMRLYPEDMEALFAAVSVGTPVRIVNQPYKAGWHKGELFLEVHAPLPDGNKIATPMRNFTPIVDKVIAATNSQPGYPINWDKVRSIVQAEAGAPVAVTRPDFKTPAVAVPIARMMRLF